MTAPTLIPGRVYRVIWPGHYNLYQATCGFLGEYQGMVMMHDALHGEPMGEEARFVRLKEHSYRRSYLFDVRLRDVKIEPVDVPSQETKMNATATGQKP